MVTPGPAGNPKSKCKHTLPKKPSNKIDSTKLTHLYLHNKSLYNIVSIFIRLQFLLALLKLLYINHVTDPCLISLYDLRVNLQHVET